MRCGKIFAPLPARHLAPDIGVGAARRLHCQVDVVRISLRDFGQFLFGGGIDGGKVFARTWGDELAVDEEFIAGLDLDVIVRLGRGRVSPFVPEVEMPLKARKRDPMINGRFFTNNNGGGGTGFLARHGGTASLDPVRIGRTQKRDRFRQALSEEKENPSGFSVNGRYSWPRPQPFSSL